MGDFLEVSHSVSSMDTLVKWEAEKYHLLAECLLKSQDSDSSPKKTGERGYWEATSSPYYSFLVSELAASPCHHWLHSGNPAERQAGPVDLGWQKASSFLLFSPVKVKAGT